MRLAIIGATGMAGTALYREGVSRGHEVTAIVRNKDKAVSLLGRDVKIIEKNVFDLSRSDIDGFDVVINAFSTSPDKAYLHLDLAAKLIALFRETERPRLFFILGAGSLLDQEGKLFLDTIKTAPNAESWISIPIEAQDPSFPAEHRKRQLGGGITLSGICPRGSSGSCSGQGSSA